MRAALGLAGGTRIGFGSCDVFCKYHRTTCTAPCSVPNWVNDVCSRYSTSNGVKGVYCKYHVVQPGQHFTKGSTQTALPWIQTRKSIAKKWDKEKGESHLECLDRSQFEMVTHPWIHFCSWQHELPLRGFYLQLSHDTACTAQY